MFPLPFNFPFRKKDGSLTTIDDAISAGGGGSYTLPTASATTKGGVKVGDGLTMDGEVLKNLNPTPATPYTLPTASGATLGGVKVGSNLSIDENGVLSASGGSPYVLPTASAETLGGVKVGSGLSITDGVLSATGGGGGGGASVTTGTLTLSGSAPSGATLANGRCEKVGDVVAFNLTVSGLSMESNSSALIANAPTDFKPKASAPVQFFGLSGASSTTGTYVPMWGRITTSGAIYVYAPSDLTQNITSIYGNACYVALSAT